MDYITINRDLSVDIMAGGSENTPGTAGTSLQGYIETSYKSLVDKFGEPNGWSDGYKIDVEWEIETPDGVATIYNWKDGHNYLGEDGDDVWHITDWHIGGHSKAVVEWIENALNTVTTIA